MRKIVIVCAALAASAMVLPAQAQIDERTKRCEVRTGCAILIQDNATCSQPILDGGSCSSGLLQGAVIRTSSTGKLVVLQFKDGKVVGPFLSAISTSADASGQMTFSYWEFDNSGHRTANGDGRYICTVASNATSSNGGATSNALCDRAIEWLGKSTVIAAVTGTKLVSEPIPGSVPQAGNERPSSPKILAGTILSSNSAARSSIKLRMPNSFVAPNSQKLEEFIPPRSANACIGTEKAGQFTHVTSSCSQPVLAVTKSNSANTMRWDGYFLATHSYKDPPASLGNQTKYDGSFETASCFKGDRHCTSLWLQTLQHCKRWAPAPNRSKETSYKGLGGVDRYPLDCAPGNRQEEDLKFNAELSTKWNSFMDANLPGKISSSDDGATQCAVQLYVPMLQIHLDTLYQHQKERGIPHSTCDASVFGIK